MAKGSSFHSHKMYKTCVIIISNVWRRYNNTLPCLMNESILGEHVEGGAKVGIAIAACSIKKTLWFRNIMGSETLWLRNKTCCTI